MDATGAWMFASFVVGTVGFGLFLYGRKQLRLPQLLTGIALMVFPYFTPSATWVVAVGASLCAGLWFVVRCLDW